MSSSETSTPLPEVAAPIRKWAWSRSCFRTFRLRPGAVKYWKRSLIGITFTEVPTTRIQPRASMSPWETPVPRNVLCSSSRAMERRLRKTRRNSLDAGCAVLRWTAIAVSILARQQVVQEQVDPKERVPHTQDLPVTRKNLTVMAAVELGTPFPQNDQKVRFGKLFSVGVLQKFVKAVPPRP